MTLSSGDSVQSSVTTAAPPLERVIFIAPFGLGQKTTVWARILPLAHYLQRHGITADLIIPPWDTPAHSGLTWADGGVKLDNVRLKGGPAPILARMLRRVQRANPQIVHIVKPVAYAGAVQSTLWTLRKLGRFSAKIVLDIDDWEQGWAVLNQRPGWMQRLITMQENWGMTHADGITAASRWLETHAQTTGKHQRPICYLPNGVDVKAFRTASAFQSTSPAEPDAPLPQTASAAANGPGGTPQRVLYFTRFMEIAPAWLADFCAELFAQNTTATLTVAGSGIRPQIEADFKTVFMAQAQQLGIDLQRIEWTGHVARSALDALYANHQCALFPAQELPIQQAKCSVRLINTLLQGVPVVASAVGEQIAYGQAGDASLLPADAPPQAYAAEVNRILADPTAARARQQAAHPQLLEQYDWNTLGARLLEFYRRVQQA